MTALISSAQNTGWTFRTALPVDWPLIEQLLTEANLPLDGATDQIGGFMLAYREARLVGAAALVVYENFGLLRSVAVQASERGSGLGQELVRVVLDRAFATG